MNYNKPNKAARNADYLRRAGIDLPYQIETLDPNKVFLIICEGENTERYYFESFPVPSKTVEVHGGKGSKTSLVDYALEQKELAENEGKEIWCIFDYDIKPDEHATQPEDFNSSIEKAQQHGLKVAWSNDSFELWFLLHFNHVDSNLHRDVINDTLKGKWNLESFHNEAKTVLFCKGHYSRHLKMQPTAIKNAKKLHQQFGQRTDYANHCSCTTVYLLVEELNKYLKK